MTKQKLELTWIGKEKRPKLEPRILLEDLDKSYHAVERVSDNDQFDNKLIFGDNLLALKALESEYAGSVKCIFIDPPYNTGNAFEHYDDGLEHSIWLGMMRERLVLLRNLLSEDGSLWITIDDNECHYLKVLCDEIFGRENFVSSVIWQKIYTTKNSAKYFSSMHDHILVISKFKSKFLLNDLPREEKQNKAYKNSDKDPRGPWKATPLHARNYYGLGRYSITSPTGRVISGPPTGTYWRVSEENFNKMDSENRIWWGKNNDGIPSQKRFLSEVRQGVTPNTLWLHTESGHNGEAKNEIRALLPEEEDLFGTPKPERLLERILVVATNKGDLVLDSFAGSGTTGAVAHKMGRKWIMVELGDHCHTHVIPRLKKVIDGEDQGGISKSVNWKGGGGFRYYKIASSLLQKDQWDNWIINKEYNPEMLAEALCKLQGFHYSPSETNWWQQGYSTETDFIYVTTQTLSVDYIAKISEEVGENRSLLICCSAFKGKKDAFSNITLKKIPHTVLNQCEWDNDDYSLNVENLPQMKQDAEQGDLF